MKTPLIAAAIAALTCASAAPAFAQASNEAVVAIENPEEWVLEYPTIIGPFVNEYYNCLRNGSYVIGDGKNFATQYDADIERCAKLGAKNEADANAMLARRDQQGKTSPAQVSHIFLTVRKIHQARGRDIDKMYTTHLSNSPQPGAAVPPCLEQLRTLRAERQTFADAQKAKLREVWDKAELSEEDRKTFQEYQMKLENYARRILKEKRSCAAS